MLRILARGFIVYEIIKLTAGIFAPSRRPIYAEPGPKHTLSGFIGLILILVGLWAFGVIPHTSQLHWGDDNTTHIEWEGTLPPETQNQ